MAVLSLPTLLRPITDSRQGRQTQHPGEGHRVAKGIDLKPGRGVVICLIRKTSSTTRLQRRLCPQWQLAQPRRRPRRLKEQRIGQCHGRRRGSMRAKSRCFHASLLPLQLELPPAFQLLDQCRHSKCRSLQYCCLLRNIRRRPSAGAHGCFGRSARESVLCSARKR